MPGLGGEAFKGIVEIGKGANLVQVAPTLDLRNTDTINLFSSAYPSTAGSFSKSPIPPHSGHTPEPEHFVQLGSS